MKGVNKTMPKLKTHTGAKKRFSLTKTGKIKRNHALKNHILTHKSTKKKRALRKTAYATSANAPAIRKLLPYD